ncbi:hypothetical protein TWF102_002998 [Orbilia oligospora]|uniref:Uncharacterized protein n=1 Tax=Orbilia oligospora TaxID=2813651 RepID=A0A7C8NS52_ORBOL|nr:hypothetical protein TWF102_002998 [Orbilia oligospora]KAF3109306.1 hypothetical protein TWF103_005183 [Orbilia oligospora]KAF3112296.1 hypothetical protein TWF706_010883 [Orbilia oligospora]KAF3150478.1 hypothetical protein TWF594_009122 [Orbilia oligospora]
MASTDQTSKLKIVSRSDFTEEAPEALIAAPRKEIPADYAERAKSVRPTDLFKPLKKSAQFGQKFDIDPNDGNGAWESGEIGAAVGKVLYELFQSYEDWANGQGDFVQQTLTGIMNEPYIKESELNVFVFSDVKSGLYFTNPWFTTTDDTAWFGILDKQYYIAVFESCWFGRHGAGGWQNWGFSWHGGSWYGARGTEDQGTNKVIITYKAQPKSAQQILDDYVNGFDTEEDMYMNIIRASSTYHNKQPTVYTINYYGSNDWNRYTMYPEDVSDNSGGVQEGVHNGVEQD